MIWDVAGIRVGHWTGDGTGVTVVLAPAGCVASGEVRGGAPATREAALLVWGSLVHRVDAVVLCGGSAFGLAAADGVMGFLAERGQGFPTSGGPVPIVVAAGVFDESARSGRAAPGAVEGRAAAEAAELGGATALGRVGAGTGATVGKWRGADHRVPGGIGGAVARCEGATVAALVVANALGDVVGADGTVIAGSTAPDAVGAFPELDAQVNPFEQTTLAVVATDARLTKDECRLVAESAHGGLARSLRPSHTRFDGDMSFALATGEVDANVDRVRVAVTDIVADAVRDAVRDR